MKRNPVMYIFFLVLFLLAAGNISYFFFLPQYIEKKILPSLGEQLSTSLTGKVLTIGLNEASLGELIIGDTTNVAASIGAIHAAYSFSSILDKKIKQIKINGLILNLEISDGRIIIPGLDLEKIVATKTKHEVSTSSSAISLPFELDNLQVTNGFINFLYENHRILIPFGLQLTREEQTNTNTMPVYRLHLQIFPQGEEIAISGSIDLFNNTGKFVLSADFLDLKPFASLSGGLQEILSFGKAFIRGNTVINLMPFQFVSTDIDFQLESANFKTVPITFGPTAESDKTTRPLRLKITGSGQQWDVSAHGSMLEPLLASIKLDGSFQAGDGAAKGFGTVLIKAADKEAEPSPAHLPVIIKGNPEVHGDFSVDITPTGAWHAKIESSGSKEALGIAYGQNSLNTKIPSFTIQGNGSADFAQMLVSLTMVDVHATSSEAGEIILPMAKLQGFFNQEKKSGQQNLASGEFSFSLPGANIKRDFLTGKGDIKLSGKMKPQPLQDIRSLQIDGELVVSNAKAEEQAGTIHINSAEGRIPWQWPISGRETTGRLKASGITWKNNELGSFEAGVKLQGSTYSLDGRFTHTLLKGLATSINGQATIVDSELYANLDLQMDPAPIRSLHLGRLDPSLNNAYLSGELGLDSKFKIDPNGFKGNMAIMMQNGRFEYPEKKYTIKNIHLALLMPSLPDLRSAPAQTILFDKASIGDLTFEQGKVVWQLESSDSIFIEETVVRWAGGRVFSNAVRISPDRKEFVVPIFCDRLILADILRQFSITNAEGEGTVSGRVPLLVGKGTVRFEDGFLYSSPGQGGSIKVAAFDLLSAGIPKSSPQFAQVDFAAEALKNFNYNWVKLLLNSEGEDLIMQMQMDGKPLQSLPFTYDSQTGLVHRVEDGSKGIDQPIRLDVNFRLPLNRFIGYSGKVQDIMKKIK